MAEVIGPAAAEKAVDKCCDVATKQIGYVWNYAEIVEKLRSEAGKYEDMKKRFERLIREAEDRGENIEESVIKWVKAANNRISDVTTFFAKEAKAKTCFNLSWCVHLCHLYSYGKEAQDMTTSVIDHYKEGNELETKPISYATRGPEHFDLCKRVNLDGFVTQKIALDTIIETILDDTKQIVGIYGLGGVGKTALANEVAIKLQKQFAKVVFVEVKHPVDVAGIKNEVAEGARRILRGERVLFIFDNALPKLTLRDVEIPCGADHKNCKILLTCQNKDVCVDMNAHSSICVNTLTYEEASKLFKSFVGERQDTEFLHEDLTKECGGLPKMIEDVGNYLQTKPIHIWQSVLARLQDETQANFSSIDDTLSRIQISYENLENEDAKSCFLLCSMFKEDGDIEVEQLTHYGVGLQIFNDLRSIKDARNRVNSTIDNLSSTLLLLGDNEKVKMQNIVRKVALLVHSKTKEKVFLKPGKGMRDWPLRPDDAKTYTRISLMENKITKLPEHELDFGLTDTFLIQENELPSVPDSFFQGMKKVKVLDMSGNKISSLPKSLRLLKKLRMLDLSKNESLNDISIVGELTDLEILKLKSTGIKKIPVELGKLINLRLLDVEYCENLFSVAPGVISELSYLEELHIGFLEKMESYECLQEIAKLTLLKTLFLSVPRCDLIPEDSHFNKLEEFRIQTARLGSWNPAKPGITRRLRVNGSSFPFTNPVKKLVRVSHAIELCFIEDLDDILPGLYQEGFDQVKSIKLQDCDNVKCLVKTHDPNAVQTLVSSENGFFPLVEEIVLEGLSRLKLLWDCPHQYICFNSLGEIRITRCSSLSSLFPISVARVLVKLRTIDISHCGSLEVVISAEDDQIHSDTDSVFPFLACIRLYQLPKLNCFYSGNSTINYPPSKSIEVRHCPGLKRCGSWSQSGI